MISNFRKYIFVKIISVLISFIFLFTRLELKSFAQPALLPNIPLQIITITSNHLTPNQSNRFADGLGHAYAFDPVGNITRITDAVHTNTQSFTYDSLNRLIYSEGDSYGTIEYTYDSIGNMTRKVHTPNQSGKRGQRLLSVWDFQKMISGLAWVGELKKQELKA